MKKFGPPIVRSLLSVPSKVKLFDRARLPLTDSVTPLLLTLPKPGTTPGASRANVSIPPPAAFEGSSSTLRVSKLDESCEVVWTTSSVFAVIVTVALGWPISSATLRSVMPPTFTSTPVSTLVLKPEVGVTVTVYLPGCRSEISKLPSPPVVNCFSIPVASFLAVTVAPVITPPLGSATVPVSLPVVAWAITGALKRKTIAIRDRENAAISANDLAMGEFLMCASWIGLSSWPTYKHRLPSKLLSTQHGYGLSYLLAIGCVRNFS